MTWFFRKKSNPFEEQLKLVEAVFTLLAKEFPTIHGQIVEGILIGSRKKSAGYIKFLFNTDLLNKFEDKAGRSFALKGVKILNKKNQIYEEIVFEIAYGILVGFYLQVDKEFEPDFSNIDVKMWWIKDFENHEFEEIKHLFKNDDLKLINPNDVYQIELHDRKFYHLKDTEDGNFIGIDDKGVLYKITHDPFEIIKLNEKLSNLLE